MPPVRTSPSWRPRSICRLLVLAAALAGLVCASEASAATISRDADGTLVVTAAPGEQNNVVLGAATDDTPGYIFVADHTPLMVTADGCEAPGTLVNCRVDPAGVRVELGDRNDVFSVNADFPSSVPVAVNGGAGDDQITGWDESDTFDGGDGNDTVDGRGGSDIVRGGNGDDTLMGDHFEDPSPDVIDGGPGNDTLENDYTSRFTSSQPDVAITLGGGADDGRPGEGDDVESIERVVVNQGGSLTGTDAPEHLEAFQTTRPVTITGGGGNDELIGSGGADTINGGSGDDFIDAGFGNDTITPGPGRDTVYADKQGGDCGPVWCTSPYGNDTVYAVDGESDTIDCGDGVDTVYADAIDVVAPDCETVIRSGSAPSGSPGAPGGAPGAPGSGSSGSPAPGHPSGHPARCIVPRVLGLTVPRARRRLIAAGCRARTRGHGRHVRRQSVPAGRRVRSGTTVLLTL